MGCSQTKEALELEDDIFKALQNVDKTKLTNHLLVLTRVVQILAEDMQKTKAKNNSDDVIKDVHTNAE